MTPQDVKVVEALSNLRANHTGADGAVIWISAGEFAAGDPQHGPRILIVLGDQLTAESLRNAVSVTLTYPPSVLGTLPGTIQTQVERFVELNRDTLIRRWAGEIGSAEAISLLERV